jgi:hypothetical protein
MPSAPRSRRLLVGKQDDEVQRALDWAEIAAMLGDYREAVGWMDRVEIILGSLPEKLASRRQDWAARIS